MYIVVYMVHCISHGTLYCTVSSRDSGAADIDPRNPGLSRCSEKTSLKSRFVLSLITFSVFNFQHWIDHLKELTLPHQLSLALLLAEDLTASSPSLKSRWNWQYKGSCPWGLDQDSFVKDWVPIWGWYTYVHTLIRWHKNCDHRVDQNLNPKRSIDKSAKKMPKPLCENRMEIFKGHRTDASCRMSVLGIYIHMMLCERYEQN